MGILELKKFAMQSIKRSQTSPVCLEDVAYMFGEQILVWRNFLIAFLKYIFIKFIEYDFQVKLIP